MTVLTVSLLCLPVAHFDRFQDNRAKVRNSVASTLSITTHGKETKQPFRT